MLKHIIKISFVFSILFLISCSSEDDTDNQTTEENTTLNEGPKKTVSYPSIFSETDVPLIGGAYILNKKELRNTKNKTGMQIWERCEKSFEDVRSFYLENLEKNGWERKTDADKQSTPEQENDEAPVRYFVTKFHKNIESENKKFVLLINVTSGNDGKTTIIKILKEM